MKKALSILLCALMLTFALCGCGDDPQPVQTGVQTSQPEPTETPTQTAPVTLVTPTKTPEPTPKVTPQVTTEPVSEPEREQETELAVYYGGESESVMGYLVTDFISQQENIKFSMYSDTASFSGSYEENAYRFVPVTDKESNEPDPRTFLEMLYIDGTTGDSLAPSFMNLYIDWDNEEFSSVKAIGADKIHCSVIVAYNDEQYITAYLADRDNGVVAFVISCSIEDNDTLRPRYLAMLDTLMLFGAQ